MATRDFSKKQETLVCNYLGADLTPNSGATGTKKGDMLTENTIIECKTKTKKGVNHTIREDWVNTLKRECISMGKSNWSIVFDFGTQELKDQLVIIPIDDYKEYLELKGEIY